MPSSSVAQAPASLRIAFAGAPASGQGASILIPSPWLAGEPEEILFRSAVALPSETALRRFQEGDVLIGHVTEPLSSGDMAARAESLYQRVLAACQGRHLFRVWNYVPAINALTPAGENYRAFCVGRARAFEEAFGPGFEARLPAASAVGSGGSRLDAIFIAGMQAPRHVENPDQVPAYRYPAEHGPRSPSFARASIGLCGGQTVAFVSGTAAIKGHRTVAPGDLEGQITCTLDNLRLISRALDRGDTLAAGPGARRHFKVYLRHPEDLGPARARLEAALFRPDDLVTYLQADICRAALDIEIEATLMG